MDTKAFLFNSQAKYRTGGHFSHFKEKADILSLANQEIMVDDKGGHFKAMFPDIFADYQNPPLTGDVAMANKAWQIWQNTLLSWWQCLFNLALWCASAGCGVSFEDHIQAEKSLLASLYRFHVYHTTRRLLEELRVALPGDKSYSWYETAYDSRAYKRLWAEFSVSLNISEGFTQAGVERLNDSIRTYVWAILGAQAQTRSNILKTGTGFDAQKQFLANIEDAIASPVDIPSSIARYQKTLQYASTPLDFVFGIGVYLSPSDMALHPGNIQGTTTRSR